MPSDKINVLECLSKAQHFQRIATKCIVFIDYYPFECKVNVTLVSDKGEIAVYKFNINNYFMENKQELQRLEEKFYKLNGIKDD